MRQMIVNIFKIIASLIGSRRKYYLPEEFVSRFDALEKEIKEANKKITATQRKVYRDYPAGNGTEEVEVPIQEPAPAAPAEIRTGQYIPLN